MLTHDKIWTAIDRLASACGYSTSGLAKKAGLDPTSFNRSKRTGPDGKPRWPSTESLARILDATGSPLDDFIAFLSGDDDIKRKGLPATSIPVLPAHLAGEAAHFDEQGYPTGTGWERIHFPFTQGEMGAVLYALEVSGDTMRPLFRSGDRLIIAPRSPVRRGDRVVVKTTQGTVMIFELARQTAGKIELTSLDPAQKNRTMNAGEIEWMARIIWVSQ